MFKFILVRNEFSQILPGTEIRYSQNQIFGNPIKPNFSETNIPARILFHSPLRTYSFSFFNSFISLLLLASSSSSFFFFSNFQLLQHQPLRNIPFLPSPSFSSFAAVSFDRPRVHTHTHRQRLHRIPISGLLFPRLFPTRPELDAPTYAALQIVVSGARLRGGGRRGGVV